MGWPVWAVEAAVVFIVALDAVLISDAVYQIVSGRPSFLPVERRLFKRVPGTPADCQLQGAGKLTVYVALLLIQLEGLLIWFLSAYGAPGGPQSIGTRHAGVD